METDINLKIETLEKHKFLAKYDNKKNILNIEFKDKSINAFKNSILASVHGDSESYKIDDDFFNTFRLNLVNGGFKIATTKRYVIFELSKFFSNEDIIEIYNAIKDLIILFLDRTIREKKKKSIFVKF